MMRPALRPALAAASFMVGLLSRDARAQPACTAPATTCGGTNGYYASKADLDRVTAVGDPLLRELRTCLDASGGKHIAPAFVIRWDSEGNPVAVSVEVPGYESLPCVAKVSGKLSQLQNPHETAIRCDFGCAKPTPPPPQQPPLVVQPPISQPPSTGQAPIPVLAPVKSEQPYSVRYEKVWYGWQGLILDAVAFTLTLGGGFSKTGGVLTTGIITFALGFPIIHMAHNEIGRGFGSIGMRVLLPLLGAGIGAIAGVSSAERGSTSATADAAETGAIIGAFIGGAGCSAIDAFALGYKGEKVEHGITSRSVPPRHFALGPAIDVRKDRGSIGIGGSF